MHLTSIIIPSSNGRLLLEKCIDSIRSFTHSDVEIIVVDNGPNDGTINYCLREQLQLIHYPYQIGYPFACNRGLMLAKGDSLLLLNNDVIVTRNWLANMLDCLYSSNQVGIVGPRAGFASGRQRSRINYSGLHEFHQMAETLNRPDPDKWEDTGRIVGFCFLLKRELLQKVGLLDERFSPGYFEDDDYCHRARLQGFRLRVAGDVHVHHSGSATFRMRQGKASSLSANYKKFVEKWGFKPHVQVKS